MEYKYEKGRISFDKILNNLDLFVVEFCRTLHDLNIRFVIVSGYVSILFGRSRETEDVDILIEKIPFEVFEKLWLSLTKRFECLNSSEVRSAFEYLETAHAIRFSEKLKFIPNMEVKFAKTDIDRLTLNKSLEVILNNKHRLKISPVEIQIVYKLYLGSEKDIEDAKFLYELFFDNIDHEELIDILSAFDKATKTRFDKIKRK